MEVAPAAELAVAPSRVADFMELTKPRITSLVLVTAAVGYAVGGGGALSAVNFLLFMVGTALLCGGASALNQYLERDADARMTRTSRRPLPAGRITPSDALAFGLAISAVGLVVLAGVNLLTLALGAASLLSYVLAYTPLKRVTSLCTIVGAVPGALPPLMGWAAARGSLGPAGWGLFAILFLWQLPHFLAIGWLYREDYARGGFPMLAVTDRDGSSTGPAGGAVRDGPSAGDAGRRAARRGGPCVPVGRAGARPRLSRLRPGVSLEALDRRGAAPVPRVGALPAAAPRPDGVRPMSAKAASNLRLLWVLIAVGVTLFIGSILFILSRAAH